MAFPPVLRNATPGEFSALNRAVTRPMQQFIEDELLRAPLLFDQLIDSVTEHALKDKTAMTPMQRAAIADLLQALKPQRPRLIEYFMRSLREQVKEELAARGRPHSLVQGPALIEPKPFQALNLTLVDEESVALDVELAHIIELIRSVAEYELRELQTFTSALVGDMDVAADHNPFRAETYARALWAAAQGLTMSRGHQVAFMRHAGPPLAQLLRKSYAASTSRLESTGVEPAAYRTVILPSGSRRGGRFAETTHAPDLYRMREAMPSTLQGTIRETGAQAATIAAPPVTIGSGAELAAIAPAKHRASWQEVTQLATTRADRQSIELVVRLFEAMVEDVRVPADVGALIARLQPAALRLMLADSSLLDQSKHPLWLFINRLAFEAEMVPEQGDTERTQLLKVVRETANQLGAEPEQTAALYRWANERLDAFAQLRLKRRVKAVSYRIDELQALEDRLCGEGTAPSTFHGLLDAPQLDTVPADLMEDWAPDKQALQQAAAWLDNLRAGDWVRVFLQGRWMHAQLLWPGGRGEIWLFGNGSTHTTHATWAVRRGALLMMHSARLAKTLKQRSIVGSAAARVQQHLAQAVAA
jgi:Protein of unknown function (DUF1631)